MTHRVRRVSQNRLVNSLEELGQKGRATHERPYFYHAFRRIDNIQQDTFLRHYTYSGRYPKLNKFLDLNKDKIKVFADVGASTSKGIPEDYRGPSPIGAPTTIEAKRLLGKEATVYAVDIFKPDSRITERGVIPIIHGIQRKPLPFQCDAIRFGNVSHHMTKQELLNSLNNIWLSLKPKGFLLGASEMRIGGLDLIHAGDRSHEFVLIKVAKTKRYPLGFVELTEITKPLKKLA